MNKKIPYLLLFGLSLFWGGCSLNQQALKSTDDIKSYEEEPIIRVLVAGRRRHHVIKIQMETYLAGVIGNEMSRRWPVEALKAQAVAARSYALYRMKEARREGRKFDVVATQGDQVFRQRDIKNDYLASIVAQTHGEVLWANGGVVQAFYSSTCGGLSRSAESAGLSQNSPIAGFRKDSYCKRSPFRSWVVSTTLDDLTNLFRKKGYKVEDLRDIRIKSKDRGGYVKSVEIADARGEKSLSGDKFRSLIGSMKLKSLLFDLKNEGEEVHFVGHGFGHGVGMCQYGAERMATQGKKYRTILSKYYPGIKVARIY